MFRHDARSHQSSRGRATRAGLRSRVVWRRWGRPRLIKHSSVQTDKLVVLIVQRWLRPAQHQRVKRSRYANVSRSYPWNVCMLSTHTHEDTHIAQSVACINSLQHKLFCYGTRWSTIWKYENSKTQDEKYTETSGRVEVDWGWTEAVQTQSQPRRRTLLIPRWSYKPHRL